MERCVAAASHHGCGICTCLHVFRLPLKGIGGRRTTGMFWLRAPGYIDARWPNCRMSNALTCPEVKSPSDYGDAFPKAHGPRPRESCQALSCLGFGDGRRKGCVRTICSSAQARSSLSSVSHLHKRRQPHSAHGHPQSTASRYQRSARAR